MLLGWHDAAGGYESGASQGDWPDALWGQSEPEVLAYSIEKVCLGEPSSSRSMNGGRRLPLREIRAFVTTGDSRPGGILTHIRMDLPMGPRKLPGTVRDDGVTNLGTGLKTASSGSKKLISAADTGTWLE